MYTKEWKLFAWEEELKVLGLEYFYIGKHFWSKVVNFYFKKFTCLFPAFIFLGIGSALSIIAFICEKVHYVQGVPKKTLDSI